MIELTLLAAGSCRHPEWVTIQGGGRKPIQIPALFALLRHPTLGPILYDTGYAPRFFDQTRRLPALVYRWITPVQVADEQTAVAQLRRLGIAPAAVRLIILSHFHADHLGGVLDFPNARFIYLPSAWAAVRAQRGMAAVRRAFLPGLLPPDFEARSLPLRKRLPLPPAFAPFTEGYDVLGDGSVLGVQLDGHATGQLGIIVGETFLCADAAWSSAAVRANRPPHPLARVIMDDPVAYRANFGALHELHRRNPSLRIIASHCGEVPTGVLPC
ncbi:MAG TPA: MBL fold metallo-hydrolase [Symbiobacteriaceae bacterium]|nr:MBL fold metallo-hydrolase [Symbiobacteriaceae bacterium]